MEVQIRILELDGEVAEAFGACAAGHDAGATFHDNLNARGVVRLDDGDEFEIDEVGTVDAEEMRGRQLGFEFIKANADEILLCGSVERDVVVGPFGAFEAGKRDWNDAAAIADEKAGEFSSGA